MLMGAQMGASILHIIDAGCENDTCVSWKLVMTQELCRAAVSPLILKFNSEAVL